MKKIFVFFIFLNLLICAPIKADTPYFLDFKYILNNSDAGKKAQDFLKKNLKVVLKI